jgi:hypothetical protein
MLSFTLPAQRAVNEESARIRRGFDALDAARGLRTIAYADDTPEAAHAYAIARHRAFVLTGHDVATEARS